MSIRHVTIIVAAMLLAANLPASADDSSNARPVIVYGSAMVDPTSLTMLGDNKSALKVLDSMNAQLKSGKIAAYVFAASADGKSWAFNSSTKNNYVGLEDLARQTLERCQSYAGVPCLILSINGHDARDANGGWPLQPSMFEHGLERFDASKVPFVSSVDRTTLAGYARASGPQALAVTATGWWSWESGKTEFDAVAATIANCKKKDPNESCLLYAVDQKVVFTAQ